MAHLRQILLHLGHGYESHPATFWIQGDDRSCKRHFLLRNFLALFGFLPIIDRFDGFDSLEITFDIRCLVPDLEEWEALLGICSCRDGGVWGIHARDAVEEVRVEDLDVEADGAVGVPYAGRVVVGEDALFD